MQSRKNILRLLSETEPLVSPIHYQGMPAIEAPYIFHKEKYYYLFVSYDYCCRRVQSNYKIMVGRSDKIIGLYVDKKGVPMIKGGATLLLAGNKHWPGAGHNAILSEHGKDYLVFHAYDVTDYGRPKLRIFPIKWGKGWPVVQNPDLK